MAQLIIKNLEDSVIARLHRRAIRHRRSLEEEVREILRSAAAEKIESAGFGTRLRKRFAGIGLDSEIEEMRGSRPPPANFRTRPRES
jgi:plasmid stability protein